MPKILAAAAAVTVSAGTVVPSRVVLPIEVEGEVITRVVTLSSSKSSWRAPTILSSVSEITTSPE